MLVGKVESQLKGTNIWSWLRQAGLDYNNLNYNGKDINDNLRIYFL